jgi:gluconolactonase
MSTLRGSLIYALSALAIVALGSVVGAAARRQSVVSKGDIVVSLDQTFSKMVSRSAEVELLKGDYFGFLEGAIWVPERSSGYLLFIDIPANRLYKWTPDDKLSVYLDRAGFTGTDLNRGHPGEDLGTHWNGRLAVVLYGPCGLALDPQHRVVMADMADRNVVRLEPDGKRTVLADRYEGKRLSGPNDVVVKSDGAVYFTDMISGLRHMGNSPLRELPFNGIYVVKDGNLRVIDKDPGGAYPNGITLSPDEKVLYANSSGKKIYRYDLQPDDSAINGRLFVDMSGETQPGGTDGIRTDQAGNLWTGGPGGLWAVSPEGKHLGTILMPKGVNVTSFAFGDPVNGVFKSVYIVSTSSLYRVRGVEIPMSKRPGPVS